MSVPFTETEKRFVARFFADMAKAHGEDLIGVLMQCGAGEEIKFENPQDGYSLVGFAVKLEKLLTDKQYKTYTGLTREEQRLRVEGIKPTLQHETVTHRRCPTCAQDVKFIDHLMAMCNKDADDPKKLIQPTERHCTSCGTYLEYYVKKETKGNGSNPADNSGDELQSK